MREKNLANSFLKFFSANILYIPLVVDWSTPNATSISTLVAIKCPILDKWMTRFRAVRVMSSAWESESTPRLVTHRRRLLPRGRVIPAG